MKLSLIALSIVSTLFAVETFSPPPGTTSARRPRVPPVEEKTSRWLFSGDFLYWIPQMDGLTFANHSVPVQKMVYNSDTQKKEKVQTYENQTREIKGDWEPGIRISSGYLFDEKGWDTLIHWTYFKNEPVTKVVAGHNERLSPTASADRGFIQTTLNAARGEWQLTQNAVDVEIGRNFPVGDVFLARPFCGAQGVSLKNKTVFHYEVHPDALFKHPSISTKSNFIGAGPRLGGNVAYEFGKGIGIFALGSGSVLYGRFDTSFSGELERNKALRTVTSLQIKMGAQWKKLIGKKAHLGFLAAWEQNFYSEANRALRHLEKNGNNPAYMDDGDLVLKGLTASCQLDF